MKRWTWAVTVLALGALGCQREAGPAPTVRTDIKTVGGATVEFLPKAGQHPYCLLYTVSEKGIIRQLTMTRENRSIKCEAGKRIYNSSFRIPVEEGKIRAYIIYSDQRIHAGSVAQQLNDLRDKPRVTAMDLRMPGAVAVDMVEFTPQAGGEPVKDAVVGTTDLAEGGQVEGSETEAEETGLTPTPAQGAPPQAAPPQAAPPPPAPTP